MYHEGPEGPAQDVRLRSWCPYLQKHFASPEPWTLFSVFFVHVLIIFIGFLMEQNLGLQLVILRTIQSISFSFRWSKKFISVFIF